jgi:hypothetical protein
MKSTRKKSFLKNVPGWVLALIIMVLAFAVLIVLERNFSMGLIWIVICVGWVLSYIPGTAKAYFGKKPDKTPGQD